MGLVRGIARAALVTDPYRERDVAGLFSGPVRRDTAAVPTFQYMAVDTEVWTETDASACERDGDTITLIDMVDDEGFTIERFTVDVHDVVELPDT